MEDYSRIIGKITSTPWMITPDALKLMLEIFDSHLNGTITQEEIRLRLQESNKESKSRVKRNGSVGVLALQGPIFPKANLMTELSGATSMEQFRNEFRQLMNDDSVDSILLDIDSPGGMSDQIEEMATEIFEARDSKPIYSIANGAANSAAYFIASQATKMYATPSGQIGSIGTYTVHVDDSEMKENRGIKETVIKAGRFKAVNMEPLNAEGKTYLQDYVDTVNDGFVKAVARGRGVSEEHVRQNFGEGGILPPQKGLENGMIDGIATFDQVVHSISEQGGGILAGKTVSLHGLELSPSASQSYDADKEHSEPGTGQGGEPTPREAPEEGDPAIVGGWRRDTPPIVEEKEELVVNREWLEARASSLGVEFTEETSDEELAEKVKVRVDEVVIPLSSATADAEKQRKFAEDYPDQAAQMADLLTKDRDSAAKSFADGFQSFAENPKQGFSPVVRDVIQEAHLKVAQRTFSHADLAELLGSVTSNEAIVPLGEAGSARQNESAPIAAGADTLTIRKQFADRVRAAMTEDGLSREAAIKHVAETEPELAQAYAKS